MRTRNFEKILWAVKFVFDFAAIPCRSAANYTMKRGKDKGSPDDEEMKKMQRTIVVFLDLMDLQPSQVNCLSRICWCWKSRRNRVRRKGLEDSSWREREQHELCCENLKSTGFICEVITLTDRDSPLGKMEKVVPRTQPWGQPSSSIMRKQDLFSR